MPIIVISSSNAIQDIEYAFSLWATDYIGKDIRYKELEIRVFHWYREYCLNKIGTKQALYDYHGLKYIPIKNEYTYKWNIIELSKSLKYIFSLFYTEQEKLLSEEYLIEKIWWYREDGEAKSALRVSLMRLRDALEKYQLWEWIETARWEGYIFRYPKKS
jgi:DNA-binding response OmpR family regulator